MKASGEQFEDRIVEVHWDPVVEGWKMMRFRDDKPTGNHIKTVESVIGSIRDGVDKETVLIPRNAEVDYTWISHPLILLSSLRNAGPSGQRGKLDTTNRTSRPDLPHTIVRDHQISFPVWLSRDPYSLLTPNRRTRAHIPTCKRVILNLSNNSIPSRTPRWGCKAFLGSLKLR